MSNKSVLGAPQVEHHGTQTTFPISRDFTFTASSGMILPVYKCFLNYGEKITGLPRFFLRTDPLLSPSMTDLDVYIDCFFVPMRHIYSMFDQWITQVSDSHTDLYDEASWENGLPVLRTEDGTAPFGWMSETIWELDTFDGQDNNITGFGFGLHRLTQHLGYNPQALFVNCADADYSDCTAIVPDPHFYNVALNRYSPSIPPYYYAAYQKYYMDCHRDTEFESNNVKAYNLDSYFNTGNLIIDPTVEGEFVVTRLSQKPRLGLLTMRYCNRNKDYFTAIKPNPLFNTIGMLPNAVDNLSIVKNWLQSGTSPYKDGDTVFVPGGTVSGSFPVTGTALGKFTPSGNVTINGAQHEGEDVSVNFTTDGGYTGFDDGRWTGITGAHNPIVGDYYTPNISAGLLSEKSNSGGSNIFSELKHNHEFSGLSGEIPGYDIAYALDSKFYGAEGDISAVVSGSASGDIAVGMQLAKLRTAFALDKLLQVTNRAGRHTDDQILAQFGVKIPKGISGETQIIKRYHTMIHIGEVVSTAQTEITDGETTSVTPLGEMAGRGTALLNSDEGFSFYTPVSGIFMACMYIKPRYKYVGAIEKDGFKQGIEDFYRPQTDNLGMQPMFHYEINDYLALEDIGVDVSVPQRNGWQWRYMEDKLLFDKVSYSFLTNGDNPWAFCVVPPSYGSVPTTVLNEAGETVYPRAPWSFNKVLPTDLNKIFVAQYDSEPLYPRKEGGSETRDLYCNFLSAYLRDPFKIDFSMQAVRHSEMSRFGEPELGGI